MSKKVLALGGTGAMGTYLVPKLVEDGYTVDVVSLDDMTSDNPRLRYIKANVKDTAVLSELLYKRYDGIVDFMIYPTGEIPVYLPLMLQNTEHYIYLSSYRVFADEEHPIVESSPRLLDGQRMKNMSALTITAFTRRAGRTFFGKAGSATGQSYVPL